MHQRHPSPRRTWLAHGLRALAGASALAMLPAATWAQAPAYPAKPVHIVVTFTPGGAPDILARVLADKLGQQWGQSVIVDNKPGAGGNIGADAVAKAPGDGHTLVVGTVGTHAINGALYKKMPYDMVRDFTPIGLLATTPNVLVVNNEVPARTLKEFIDLGKRQGNMAFASSGSGTSRSWVTMSIATPEAAARWPASATRPSETSIIAVAPANPSSAGWKIRWTLPGKLRVSARYFAAPRSMVV